MAKGCCSPQEILASIKERGVLSDELGMYWKVPYFFSSSVFAAPVSTQALVIEAFREVTGDEASADGVLEPILANSVIFGSDLTATPLKDKIIRAFRGMLQPGGVRRSLQKV